MFRLSLATDDCRDKFQFDARMSTGFLFKVCSTLQRSSLDAVAETEFQSSFFSKPPLRLVRCTVVYYDQMTGGRERGADEAFMLDVLYKRGRMYLLMRKA